MKKFTGFLMIAVLLAACVKKEEYDFDNLSTAGWEPQLAIPLVKSSLEVQDILGFTDSSVVTTDGDGLVTLVYNSDVQEFVADDIVEFGDVSETVQAGVSTGTIVVDVPFDLPGEQEFTQIDLETGNLNLNLNTSATGTATVTLLSIKETSSGNPLTQTAPLGSSINFDLSGASIEPTANNEISIQFAFSSVSSPSTMNLGMAMTNLDYKRLFGDFKDKLVRLPQDSLKIHLFKNIASDGNIHLEDPRIILDFENSLGVPLGLKLDSVDGYNPVTKHLFEVIKSNTGELKVGAPDVNSIGTTVKTQIILDRSNTNVGDVFKPTPTYLVHSVGVSANPDATTQNFVEKGAKCRMEMRIELPLVGRVEKFQILDTIPISLDQDIDFLRGVTIKTFLENGFPIDAVVKATILDENYVPLKLANGEEVDLISSAQVAASAIIDGNGKVTEPGYVSTENELSEERTELLRQAKYVLVLGSLSTSNNGNTTVKIFDDYKIDVKIGVKLTGDPGVF
ncbi:hypothetical protein KFE98_05045 [bacterium SCSIO 12741]|nr:hypothetical protein KFE98_05045 [bacterium SCSIO 12741]